MKLRVLCGLSLLLLLAGCRGWDDDSEYEIGTRASFFLMPATNGYSIMKYDEGNLQADWNVDIGFSIADLSAVAMSDGYLWLASGTGNRLVKVNPETGMQEEEVSGLPLRPHHLAIGRSQMIVCDTAAGAIAFIKRRNNKITQLEFEGKPGQSIYTNGRFYTQVDDSMVYVFDESAFTPRAILSIGAKIIGFQLDRYNNVGVRSQDTAGVYQAIIASNADYVSRENFEVAYQKSRLTPYFNRRYTTEYLNDLQLLDSIVQTPQAAEIMTNVDNFEADFFGGTLFFSRGDSFFRYDLNQNPVSDPILLGILPGVGSMQESWHQLVDVN